MRKSRAGGDGDGGHVQGGHEFGATCSFICAYADAAA